MSRAEGEWQFDWQGYRCPNCGLIVENHTADALVDCLWAVRDMRKQEANTARTRRLHMKNVSVPGSETNV